MTDYEGQYYYAAALHTDLVLIEFEGQPVPPKSMSLPFLGNEITWKNRTQKYAPQIIVGCGTLEEAHDITYKFVAYLSTLLGIGIKMGTAIGGSAPNTALMQARETAQYWESVERLNEEDPVRYTDKVWLMRSYYYEGLSSEEGQYAFTSYFKAAQAAYVKDDDPEQVDHEAFKTWLDTFKGAITNEYLLQMVGAESLGEFLYQVRDSLSHVEDLRRYKAASAKPSSFRDMAKVSLSLPLMKKIAKQAIAATEQKQK